MKSSKYLLKINYIVLNILQNKKYSIQSGIFKNLLKNMTGNNLYIIVNKIILQNNKIDYSQYLPKNINKYLLNKMVYYNLLDFTNLSKYDNLPINFINQHINKLNILYICKYNKNININFIQQHNLIGYAHYLSNKNIPFDYIRNNNRFDWNYNILHKYHNIPIEFIKENINENWNYIELSNIIENNEYKYKNLILNMINKII